ncbi:Vacuolar fusion protein mon1 [Savitreella phatthalungensis]
MSNGRLVFSDDHFGSSSSRPSSSSARSIVRPSLKGYGSQASLRGSATTAVSVASAGESVDGRLNTLRIAEEAGVSDGDDEEDEDTSSVCERDLDEDDERAHDVDRWLSRRKHFLILSAAGKPIYSRWGSSSVTAGYMGIFQAVLGFYTDSGDTLRSFEGDGATFVFSAKNEIILVAVSRVPHETVSMLAGQLDLLHAQILSCLTRTQLERVFVRGGSNFDLRRVLTGNEVFLDGLCDKIARGDLELMFNGMHVLRLRSTFRKSIESILLEKRSKNVLYAIIAHDRRLAAVLRPRAHSLFPSDLRLLLETMYRPGVRESSDEHWIPLCLPKFNDSGFLHLYVCFPGGGRTAVALVSADKDAFYELRVCAGEIERSMRGSNLMREVERAGERLLLPGDVGAPQIDHFVYRSNERVQLAASPLPTDRRRRNRVIRAYRHLLATRQAGKIHAVARGQLRALAWETSTFAVYAIARADRCETAGLIAAANAIHNFAAREASRLFMASGAAF